MMKKFFGLCLVFFVLGMFSQPLIAEEEEDYSNEPWEKAALYLGAFFITSNSDLQLGTGGAKVKIDAEEVLGLDENYKVFRADALWRMTRRNRLDFSYYAMNRDGSNDLQIEFPLRAGDRFRLVPELKPISI